MKNKWRLQESDETFTIDVEAKRGKDEL